MTPFDKAREIVAAQVNMVNGKNWFLSEDDAFAVARALLAYEPTSDAREAAESVVERINAQVNNDYGAGGAWCPDFATGEIAAVITTATAASEAALGKILDEYEIAMPGGSENWTLADRVRIACMAATDEGDKEALAKVRAETIEECAKVIDDYEKGMAGRLCCAGQRHHLASAIRALGGAK